MFIPQIPLSAQVKQVAQKSQVARGKRRRASPSLQRALEEEDGETTDVRFEVFCVAHAPDERQRRETKRRLAASKAAAAAANAAESDGAIEDAPAAVPQAAAVALATATRGGLSVRFRPRNAGDHVSFRDAPASPEARKGEDAAADLLGGGDVGSSERKRQRQDRRVSFAPQSPENAMQSGVAAATGAHTSPISEDEDDRHATMAGAPGASFANISDAAMSMALGEASEAFGGDGGADEDREGELLHASALAAAAAPSSAASAATGPTASARATSATAARAARDDLDESPFHRLPSAASAAGGAAEAPAATPAVSRLRTYGSNAKAPGARGTTTLVATPAPSIPRASGGTKRARLEIEDEGLGSADAHAVAPRSSADPRVLSLLGLAPPASAGASSSGARQSIGGYSSGASTRTGPALSGGSRGSGVLSRSGDRLSVLLDVEGADAEGAGPAAAALPAQMTARRPTGLLSARAVGKAATAAAANLLTPLGGRRGRSGASRRRLEAALVDLRDDEGGGFGEGSAEAEGHDAAGEVPGVAAAPAADASAATPQQQQRGGKGGGRSSSARTAGELNTPWSKLLLQRPAAASASAAAPSSKRGGAKASASAGPAPEGGRKRGSSAPAPSAASASAGGGSAAARKKKSPAAGTAAIAPLLLQAAAAAAAAAAPAASKGYAAAGPLHRTCLPLPLPADCAAVVVVSDPSDRACAAKAEHMRERVSGPLGAVVVLPDVAHVGHGLVRGAAGGGGLLSADFVSTIPVGGGAGGAPPSTNVFVVASAAAAPAAAGRSGGGGKRGAAPLQLARRRTHRFTCGLLSGAIVVSAEWLGACAQAGFLVHEAPYALAGDRSLDPAALALATSGGGGAPTTPSQRAQAAVWSRDPSALLLAGVTVLLWGEFERPPKNLTGTEAAELVALAGGRALRLGDLGAIPASATLRGLAQAAAGAASGAMVQALSQSQAAMDDEGGEGGGGGGGAAREDDDEEDPAAAWTSLVAEAARVCGRASGGAPGGVAQAQCGPPCPPIVILCDEPAFSMPPCVAALVQAYTASASAPPAAVVAAAASAADEGGSGFRLARPAVCLVRPEWLESSASAYYRLPTDVAPWRHAAVA